MKKFVLRFTVVALVLSTGIGGYAYYQYSAQSKRWYKTFFGGKPTADEILANYYKQVGEGPQAEQKSMKLKATMTMSRKMLQTSYIDPPKGQTGVPMGPVEMELMAKFPNKFRMEATSSVAIEPGVNPKTANIQITQAFDGEKGWKSETTPAGKYTAALDMGKVDELKNDLSLKHINLLSKYKSVISFGEQQAEGFEAGQQKEFYVLQGVSNLGTLEKLYFSVETGLLERIDVDRGGGPSSITKTFFGDYRDVQGVKLPFKSRADLNVLEMIMTVSAFELNVPVGDDIFVMPSA